MNEPGHYRQRLSSYQFIFQGSDFEEARAALSECRRLQSELRQMKREVNQDIKEIRAGYRVRMANPAAISSTVFSLFGKRKIAGSLRADARRGLRLERDRTIEPYDGIKLAIDDLLHQLDAAKTQLSQFIAADKASGPRRAARPAGSSKQTGTAHCTSCGSKVGSSDRFCRRCGASQSVVGSPSVATLSTEPPWVEEARRLLAEEGKIHAIKLVRENSRLGLKEAKDLVESWE